MRLEITLDGQKEVYSLPKKSCVVGRSKQADVCIPMEGLSRKHFQIDIEGTQIFVTDLASSNGIYLNGDRVPANEKVQYQSFLPMTIGPFITMVFLDDEVMESPPPRPVFQSAPSTQGPPDNDDFESTRTIKVDLKQLQKLKKAREKAEKKTSWHLPVFLMLVMAGGGFYFYQQKVQEMAAASQASIVTEKQSTKETPAKFFSNTDYMDFSVDINCNGDYIRDVCTMLGINGEWGEGILLKKTDAIIFLNLIERHKNKRGDKFKALPLATKYESILAEKLFHLVALFQLTKAGATHLHIVGFEKDKDEIKPLSILILPIKDADRLDNYVVDSIMNHIFMEGDLHDFEEKLAELFVKQTFI